LLFTIKRLPWGFAALKSMRRQPYVALAGTFTLLFVIAFSSLPNFGLLARQRVQLYPFFLVLLSIPYLTKKPSDGDTPQRGDAAGEEPIAFAR
jgi:hypothetical protein